MIVDPQEKTPSWPRSAPATASVADQVATRPAAYGRANLNLALNAFDEQLRRDLRGHLQLLITLGPDGEPLGAHPANTAVTRILIRGDVDAATERIEAALTWMT